MWKKFRICFFHACMLLLIHFVYYNMNLTMPEEVEVIGAIGKTHRHFSGESSYKDSGIVFINTAYDNALLHKENDNGDSINVVVTDRTLLARLFKKMADYNNQHRYALCDLIFDLPSPQDKILQAQILRVRNMIVPLYNSENKSEPAIFYPNRGLANYVTFEGKISKIRLYASEEKQKTLPLLMYENYTGNHVSKTWLGLGLNGSYLPLSFYPRYFFNNENFRSKELTLRKAVQLLEIEDQAVYDGIFKDKIVVIGNFETDTHLNPLGEKLAGSLVLFNTFLSLLSGYPMHGWTWFIFVFTCFFFLSHFAIYHHRKVENTTRLRRLLHFLGVSGLSILLCVVSDLFFLIHTSILPVILYFEAVHLSKHLRNIRLPAWASWRSPARTTNRMAPQMRVLKSITSKKKI